MSKLSDKFFRDQGADLMRRSFSLEYWIDDSWFVGRLKEIPGVFGRGETLKELVENIWDAYLVLQQQLFFDDKSLDLQAVMFRSPRWPGDGPVPAPRPSPCFQRGS
jgi:predicted RNase H-like HicB family nuclease